MVPNDSGEYRYCVERLMADVNAAVDGAFLGGAEHVTVLDSHGGGGNFDLSLLDPRAEHDAKENKKWWGKLDASYWGSFFIGAHAMAGTLNGFLDHTQDSLRIYNYIVNGRRLGELGQWAMVSGHFDVPMLMVSGDQCGVNEAAQFFSGVETAAVKIGLSRSRAELVPLREAEDRIRQAAKRAVQRAERPLPFKPLLPMEIKIDFTRADYCDSAVLGAAANAVKNGVNNAALERLEARTIRKVSESLLDFWY
jgi:D-amino peptidase